MRVDLPSILAALLFFNLASAQEPATKEPEPIFVQSEQGFTGIALLITDSDWQDKFKKGDNHYNAQAFLKVGQTGNLVMFFANPKMDAEGKIDVSADIEVRYPDGKTKKYDHIPLSNGLQRGPLFLAENFLAITALPTDTPGERSYNIKITDNVRKATITLERKIDIQEGTGEEGKFTTFHSMQLGTNTFLEVDTKIGDPRILNKQNPKRAQSESGFSAAIILTPNLEFQEDVGKGSEIILPETETIAAGQKAALAVVYANPMLDAEDQVNIRCDFRFIYPDGKIDEYKTMKDEKFKSTLERTKTGAYFSNTNLAYSNSPSDIPGKHFLEVIVTDLNRKVSVTATAEVLLTASDQKK